METSITNEEYAASRESNANDTSRQYFVPASISREDNEDNANHGFASGSEISNFYLSVISDGIEERMETAENPDLLRCLVCSRLVDDPFSLEHLSSTAHQVAELSERPPRVSSLFIPRSNRGYQILCRLGWTDAADEVVTSHRTVCGGGLGRQGDGLRFPVSTILKRDRAGLGVAKDNGSRITHFAAHDTSAIAHQPRLTIPRRHCVLNKKLYKNKLKLEKKLERRFRDEFNYDNEQLSILYN